MRIAISGTHGTGKSTLVRALAGELPTYEWLDEAYHAMTDEGHLFVGRPSVQDFEQLLERSLNELAEPLPRDILFDRCPLDYLAYLDCLSREEDLPLRRWIPEVSAATSRLDLIVYVSIERPDRIRVSFDEGKSLRRRVDGVIRDMIVEDAWGFGVAFIAVHGSVEERCSQVMAYVLGAGASESDV